MSSLSVVARGACAEAVSAHVPGLVAESFASRLFSRDAALWGPEAEEEAGIRLGWVGLHRSSRPLVGEIEALREELRTDGVDRIVLCGMGGSSLAPEVICATAGVPLVVLDSSDPSMIRTALDSPLENTAVVVSSKSGSTLETDSQRRAFVAAFEAAGIDPSRRIVIVTDPDSPLDQESRAQGYRVVNADPEVGGRYSALTAFGLVPSGLAGADIGRLLDEAEEIADLLEQDDEGNPGLTLGAALAGTSPLRDKIVIADRGSGLVGFADWAEQLIAESTGKNGRGLLPVVAPAEPTLSILTAAGDVTLVELIDSDNEDDDTAEADSDDDSTSGTHAGALLQVGGNLGAQMLLWEVATVVAGRLLGINPFDQPDVESAKVAARELMQDSDAAQQEGGVVDGPVRLHATHLGPADSITDLRSAVASLLAHLDTEHGYLAVMAYLDRWALAGLEEVASTLTERTARPVTFGWGPRFLHSTGQLHKGGPATGVFLQITADPEHDEAVPGRDFTFGEFIAAQAGGDAAVLADHDRPLLRVHLSDIPAGVAHLRAALAGTG